MASRPVRLPGPLTPPTATARVTSTFVGPDGTQIQWSKAAGLVAIPAALAATIPGFGADAPTAEGTTSVTKLSMSAPEAPAAEKKGSKWWWWIPIILALLPRWRCCPWLSGKPCTGTGGEGARLRSEGGCPTAAPCRSRKWAAPPPPPPVTVAPTATPAGQESGPTATPRGLWFPPVRWP